MSVLEFYSRNLLAMTRISTEKNSRESSLSFFFYNARRILLERKILKMGRAASCAQIDRKKIVVRSLFLKSEPGELYTRIAHDFLRGSESEESKKILSLIR